MAASSSAQARERFTLKGSIKGFYKGTTRGLLGLRHLGLFGLGFRVVWI